MVSATPIITVRPGPTVCAFIGGKLVAEVALTRDAALTLIADLARVTKEARP